MGGQLARGTDVRRLLTSAVLDEVDSPAERDGRRPQRFLRAAPAFVPALLVALGGWAHRWMDEDAFINLRIVDQVMAGHGPVFNAGERIEAATSPLWLAVLVLGRIVFGAFVAAEWIALLASLLTAVAAFIVGGYAARVRHRDDDGVVVPVGLLFVAAVAVVWDFSTSGLEIGLVWLWLASAWLVLMVAVRSPHMVGRRRFVCGVVLGLAPLVRPELTLTMVFLLVAWFYLVRPRRVVFDLIAIFALPVAYQIFRMGFYASVVPNTALAKDAGGLHLSQGWAYLRDFVGAYRLWVTALLIVAVLVINYLQRRERRMAMATGAMVLGGLANGLYIILIGGDYMHGRLLLPAFFAIALPASIAVRRARLPELGLAALAGAWALVSILWFRPPVPPPGYVVAPISDWRVVSGARIYPADTAFGLNGNQAADLYAQGVRGYFRAAQTQPLPANDPNAFVYTLGSIGVPAYDAGRRIWVVDMGGLAEPLAARTSTIADRPAGHRKQVDEAWYVARFSPPQAGEDPKVTAARHALTCGQLKELMDDVDGSMTVGRFFSNIVDSFSNTRLHIPADPIEAERQFC